MIDVNGQTDYTLFKKAWAVKKEILLIPIFWAGSLAVYNGIIIINRWLENVKRVWLGRSPWPPPFSQIWETSEKAQSAVLKLTWTIFPQIHSELVPSTKTRVPKIKKAGKKNSKNIFFKKSGKPEKPLCLMNIGDKIWALSVSILRLPVVGQG